MFKCNLLRLTAGDLLGMKPDWSVRMMVEITLFSLLASTLVRIFISDCSKDIGLHELGSTAGLLGFRSRILLALDMEGGS